MAYNNSARSTREKTLVEPTNTEPGLARSLHPTKGWRYSRIAPLNAHRSITLAQRLILSFFNGRALA